MLYCALASDYDGTLATDGRVDDATMQALEQFKATGKKLILATGRELRDLRAVFEGVRLFDVVIAENGAVLYFPATQEERALAAPPPEEFVAALRAKGVDPLSVGRSVVATWTPNEGMVLDAIREIGLDWQLIFNKGAVMCLPADLGRRSRTSSCRPTMSWGSAMLKTTRRSCRPAAARSPLPMRSRP
jgi:hypothetical protein